MGFGGTSSSHGYLCFTVWSALKSCHKPSRHDLGVVRWSRRGFMHCTSQRLPTARGPFGTAAHPLAAAATTDHVNPALNYWGGYCVLGCPLNPSSCLGETFTQSCRGKSKVWVGGMSQGETWHGARVRFSHICPFWPYARAPSSHWASETGNKLF